MSMVTTAFFVAFALPKLNAAYAWILLIILTASYIGWKQGKLQTQRWIRIVHGVFWAALAGLIVHAVALASSQYIVWKSNWLTRHFLSATLPQHMQVRLFADWLPVFRGTGGYFAYYTFTHFVLGGVVAVVLAAGGWYSLLKALEKHKSRFFEEGEVVLGFVCALIVGWPGVVIFIPLTFLFFSIIAVVRVAALKKQFTTIAVPLLLATATTLLVAETIIATTGLKVLKI